MKTKEELNALKEETEALSKKIAELSEDELKEVAGGFKVITDDDEASTWQKIVNWFFKIVG